MGAIAGCTSDDTSNGGGDGGDGGDGSDGSDGDGGDGGDGGGGDGGDGGGGQQTVTVTTAPINVDGLVGTYMKEEGVLQRNLNDAGYDGEIRLTWDGPTLFAADKAQVSNISVTEGARMAKERGFQLVSGGRVAACYEAMLAKRGTKWDPAETGGMQETVDLIAEEGGKIAIHSWGVGFVPADKIIWQEVFGKNFSEDSQELNIVTADFFSQPKLLMDEQIALGTNTPTHGSAPYLMKGEDESELVPVYWQPPLLREAGFGTAPLVNNSCRKSFYDEHPDAFRAVIKSWDEGMKWFFENGADLMTDEKWRAFFGLEDNQAAAEYVAAWLTNADVPFQIDAPTFYEDVFMDQDYIDEVTTFMDAAAKTGLEPEDWKDHIQMVEL